MEKTELTYIYDPETGYPVQVTPEQRKRYLELWGMFMPKIDHHLPGRALIFGTAGMDDPWRDRMNMFFDFAEKGIELLPVDHFFPLLAKPPADILLKPPAFIHPLNIRPWQQRKRLCRLRKKPSLLRRKLSKVQRPVSL